MSAFDAIDRQFRKPKKPEVVLEPPAEGDPCPDPNCRGRYRAMYLTGDEPRTLAGFKCDGCDHSAPPAGAP